MKKEKVISIVLLLVIVGVLLAVNNIVYQINPSRCNECRNCLSACDVGAITYSSSTHKCTIDANLCEGCGDCVEECNRNAIYQTVVAGDDVVLPQSEMKLNVYPNPVQTNTQIDYTLPKGTQIAVIRIFNVKGELVDQWKVDNSKGQISWNKNNAPSGTYFVQMNAGKEKVSKKLLIVK
jgi:Pyruvate/2-oxoacid:ferredoxin oxidoreductase delta subunit